MSGLDQIELSISEAEKRVNKAKKAIELYDNPLFKELVVEGYFEQEAIRLVGLYGAGVLDDNQKQEVQRDMHGVGSFRRFLRNIVRDGEQAELDLNSAKDQREEYLYMQAQQQADGQATLDFDSDYAGSLGA